MWRLVFPHILFFLPSELLRSPAMQAPSAGNQQPWEFYVIKNKETIRKLSESTPYSKCAAGAPVVIVTVMRKNCRMPEYAETDLSICMENMWLMTDSLGLGGVWLGIAPIEERMKKIEEIVGLPEDVRAFGLFALGYPAESRPQQNRFDPDRIHWEE